MKRPLLLLVVVVALVGAGTAYAVAASGSATARKSATVKLRSTHLGRVLVDARGRTLYEFLKDKPGGRSRCSGDCAANWPPLTTSGRPRAGDGVSGRMLGTIRRRGGARQVTYAGHPLYRFIGDAGPGDTTGQGLRAFGARWYALKASGTRAGAPRPKPSNTPPPGY
jgi:predicted lipoprotein with Yx(FWY)xxD motif